MADVKELAHPMLKMQFRSRKSHRGPQPHNHKTSVAIPAALFAFHKKHKVQGRVPMNNENPAEHNTAPAEPPEERDPGPADNAAPPAANAEHHTLANAGNKNNKRPHRVDKRKAPDDVALSSRRTSSQATVGKSRRVKAAKTRTDEDRDADKVRKEGIQKGDKYENLKTSFWVRAAHLPEDEQQKLIEVQKQNEDNQYIRDYLARGKDDGKFFCKNFGGRLDVTLSTLSRNNTFMTINVDRVVDDLVLDQVQWPKNRTCWTSKNYCKVDRSCHEFHKNAMEEKNRDLVCAGKKFPIDKVPKEVRKMYEPLARVLIGWASSPELVDPDTVHRFSRQYIKAHRTKNDVLYYLPANTGCEVAAIFSGIQMCEHCLRGYLGTHNHPWTWDNNTKDPSYVTPSLSKANEDRYTKQLGKEAQQRHFTTVGKQSKEAEKWSRLSISQRLSIKNTKASLRQLDSSYLLYRVQHRQEFARAFCAAKVRHNISCQAGEPLLLDAYNALIDLSGHIAGTKTSFKTFYNETTGPFLLSGVSNPYTGTSYKDYFFEIASGFLGYFHSHKDTTTGVHHRRYYPVQKKDKRLKDWGKDHGNQHVRNDRTFSSVSKRLPVEFQGVAGAFRPSRLPVDQHPAGTEQIAEGIEEERHANNDITWWIHAVPHLVTPLKNVLGYQHAGEGPTYQADYCVFNLPECITALLPSLKEKLLGKYSLDIPKMIRLGMRRRNGNDNLFHDSHSHNSGRDLLRNIVGRDSAEVTRSGDALDAAVLHACRYAMRFKNDNDMSQQFPSHSISYRVNVNVPDITKRTMECMHSNYPPHKMSRLNGAGACVMRVTFPLDEYGHMHRVFTGRMNTADVAGPRIDIADKNLRNEWRGRIIYICPGSMVCFDASVPTSEGFTVTTGFEYYIEAEIIFSGNNLTEVRTILGEPFSLESYLTSKGPALDLVEPEKKVSLTTTLQGCSTRESKTSFVITKDLDLPSVVYISPHGTKSALREALLDQFDKTIVRDIGVTIWFGDTEWPQEKDKEHHPYETLPDNKDTVDYDALPDI